MTLVRSLSLGDRDRRQVLVLFLGFTDPRLIIDSLLKTGKKVKSWLVPLGSYVGIGKYILLTGRR